MTRTELQTFVNDNLLDGRTMDADLFGILLNLAKNKVEAHRPWVVLRNEDSSQAIAAASSWNTPYTLPTRFAKPHPVKRGNGAYSPLVLVSGTEVVPLTEIQWPQRLEYQNTPGYFAINYAAGTFIVTGPTPKAYTAYWSFIKYSPALTDDADTWVFDSEYHALLGYLVAIMEKSRDYDEVNLENIKLYSPEAGAILSALVMADDARQRSMLGV